MPLLLQFGLVATWCGLGVVCLMLTAAAWGCWPATPPTPRTGATSRHAHHPIVWVLLVAYGLNAAGLVPHMVFLVDFVARYLHRGLAAGAGYWVAFGLGAMAGPLLAGMLADRVGFRTALRVAFLLQAGAVALPAVTDAPAWLLVSSIVTGAFTPGIVPLALGRVHELLPGDPVAQRLVWGRTTMAWALFQAGSAYLYSWLFSRTGDYPLLFACGAAALLLALASDLAAGRLRTSPQADSTRASSTA
ncbi:MAG: YbfB/YjiJ family MFS transporter [Acetobacteraceae bacterium]